MAVKKVLAHFANHDRGKLIMACGTGKTITYLKIAEQWCDEKKAKKKGLVLVLVPSIALIGQKTDSPDLYLLGCHGVSVSG